MNSLAENQINKFIGKRKIIYKRMLSNSFNMKCEKFSLEDDEVFVAKYYKKKENNFNSIVSEANSLFYLNKKFPKLFPNIKYKSKELLIIDYIDHNNIKNKNYQKILVNVILKLHSITNDKYGFEFDAQIGGLKQSNKFETNWINFFREKRLNMIFEKINNISPMPSSINNKIEKLLKKLEDFLPFNPKISLLHGDLWEGNILFNNGQLVGLIDPGIYFGHHELEIAYLTWFKFIDKKFLDLYNNNNNQIDKYFFKYEPIYQLYYSLLNVALWDREFYIKDTNILLNKIFKHKD